MHENQQTKYSQKGVQNSQVRCLLADTETLVKWVSLEAVQFAKPVGESSSSNVFLYFLLVDINDGQKNNLHGTLIKCSLKIINEQRNMSIHIFLIFLTVIKSVF